MPIQIFDTLANKKREFVPLEPGRVRLYACGPTVYDLPHLGHARCYIVWDVVVRHLRARGHAVTYARNYTDVDDKIIKRANERGQDPIAFAAHHVAEFRRDMASLGNLPPEIEPKVSEHIPEIVALIERIIARGVAYPSGGDVYFAVRKFPEYGKLSRRNLDDLLSGARVEPGEAKRDPLDFALWKAAKPGEPSWDSPWGKGRPGWHIECSAMTVKHLGETFDIHSGGKDLVFPHHENEIAQSEAAYGPGFARYWMHNGFVELDSEKMSKSLGNFFTVRDVMAKFDAEALRYFLLGTHYRNPINFSDGAVAEAERRLAYLYETLDRVDQLSGAAIAAAPISAWVENARAAMDDDFNTAQVLALLAEAFTAANALADERGKAKPEALAKLAAFARDARTVGLGLGILQRSPAVALRAIRDLAAARRGIDKVAVESQIAARLEARKAKDFARADAIRADLKQIGVGIKDTPAGTTWQVE